MELLDVVIVERLSSQGAMRDDDVQQGEDGDSNHGGRGDKCLRFHNLAFLLWLIFP